MNTQFTVDLDRLDQLVTKLVGLAAHVNQQLDLIDEKVAGLDGAWEARAAGAYRDAHQKWAAGAREFAAGIAEISQAARATHDRYRHGIQINQSMLRGD